MKEVILFLVITFVYWIINFLAKKKDQKPVAEVQRRPARPPRDDRVQSEIDIFLQEVGAGRKIDNPREDDIFIEIIPEEEPRRPLRQRTTIRQVRQQKKLAEALQNMEAQTPSIHQLPGSNIAQREEPGSSDLGSGVRDHVSDHMRKGVVGEHVQQHLSHDINKSVKQHLGISSHRDQTQQRGDGLSNRTHTIARLLRDPAGVRQAILMNEILSPPKGLRRSS